MGVGFFPLGRRACCQLIAEPGQPGLCIPRADRFLPLPPLPKGWLPLGSQASPSLPFGADPAAFSHPPFPFSGRHHKAALRSVAFHPSYPLFASGSDDGSVIVCHGMVYK